MVMTGWVVVSGLVLGALVARYPFYRSWFVLGVVAAMALAWAVVLARSTPAPMWMLVVLVCLDGDRRAGVHGRLRPGPHASPRRRRRAGPTGSSTSAASRPSLLTMALIGMLLDPPAAGGSSAYDLDDFRVAMSVQFVFWGFGAVQILRYRHKASPTCTGSTPVPSSRMKRGEAFVHPGFHEREGV